MRLYWKRYRSLFGKEIFFIMGICYQTLGIKHSLVGHRLDNSWYFILKRTHIWMPFQITGFLSTLDAGVFWDSWYHAFYFVNTHEKFELNFDMWNLFSSVQVQVLLLGSKISNPFKELFFLLFNCQILSWCPTGVPTIKKPEGKVTWR